MRNRTFVCIGVSLLAIAGNNTIWAEETVWETSNDGVNEQWGESQTDAWQPVETQQESWQEENYNDSSESSVVSEIGTEEATESTQEYVKPLGWSINAEAVAEDYRSQVTLEGGYYTDGRVWISASGTIPLQQDNGTIIEKPFTTATFLIIDAPAESCYVNVEALAGVLDQLTDGQTFQNMMSIWTQDNNWVYFTMPVTEEGEGLWDGILAAMQSWFPEGQNNEKITDVKSSFPKWWADQMVSSIEGFLDICEATGIYDLYRTVIQTSNDGTDWEQLVVASPTAKSLLETYWSTVSDEDYELGKKLLFGEDEKGLSSNLSINAEDVARGNAIYTRKLLDQELVRLSVYWNLNVDNLREPEWPQGTISIGALKENYLILMNAQESSVDTGESIPETFATDTIAETTKETSWETTEGTENVVNTEGWNQEDNENPESWADTNTWEETNAAQ